MKKLPIHFFTVCFLTIAITFGFTGCGDQDQSQQNGQDLQNKKAAHAKHQVSLSIVSGSENKALAPVFEQFASENGIDLIITYMGSVDIAREIAKGNRIQYDAVWPASSLWFSIGGSSSLVKHTKSIMRSPVVFAVKKSVADKLEWCGKDVKVTDILKALEEKKIRFAMTSATQSNSGASAFLGFLSAFAGSPEVLTHDHLDSPELADQIKRFLRTVDRSSGSSGWLKEMLLENYLYFDGMVNYESMVIEFNQELGPNQDPLYAIYPVGGITIADSPLGYIDKGEPEKEEAFLNLQSWLLSDKVQKSLRQQGRRTGLIGLDMNNTNTAVFNPEWGIDIKKLIVPVTIPSATVVSEALNLYQTAFRKPSLTAYVLDYSGSMQGTGEAQLKKAMRTLLDQNIAKEFLLQSSPEDITYVVPFNSKPIAAWKAVGNDEKTLTELLTQVESLNPAGGTNMYKAAANAVKLIKEDAESGKYHTSVIVMSDGASKGSFSDFEQSLSQLGVNIRDIPVFTILFGEAEVAQMESLAKTMSGRMFDGRKDVVLAFREAKGYN
ncbi:von Willebrand factor type A [Desulfamplus magnetovallimortis]|uniref:von Willebrand factor type A n=1 Tax=Desulfamplus magnetovallimortis TaxID=1246637 RepID=A0A1W1HJW9_9BACT|nr:substrate-binding and VWA domain-containing protein [Desulfamplus magnetovallimortis]SLM32658.1 von Willebrand factor type A [Desulfamplus magnetovallimortis]